MNYASHYSRLVERARHRVLEGYVERHHVLPRCMGGTDDFGNIVQLTAEEHYVAHQLLIKMHPEVPGLVWAVVRMSGQKSRISSKLYAWLRRRASIARSEFQRGKPLSAARREKLQASRLGRPCSPETRAKLSASNKGTKPSPQARAAVADANRKRVISDETRAKLKASHKDNPLRIAHASKLSVILTGRHHSAETRAKIGMGNKGKVRSAETRAKIAASLRARSSETVQ